MTDLGAAMDRALALAARAGGRTSPNPMVGAVALDPRSGTVLAEGFHRVPGLAHAEVALLDDAEARGVDLRGSTLVCTLEPCAHHGRTPPCAPRVVAAGFAGVVVAMRDPNPLVDGGGLQLLRAAGIDVVEGVREREARRLNEGFLHWTATGRPFVHVKIAMLEDGTVYRGPGAPREISSAESRRLVHWWRHLAPAVLVGSGTLRVDDPRLTVRELPEGAEVERWQPRRVVLSTRFDVPPHARAFAPSPGGPPPLVIGGQDAPAGAERALQREGVETPRVPVSRAGLDLHVAFEVLSRLGVTAVLVEPGPRLAEALLAEGLVDRLSLLIAGGDGMPDDEPPPERRMWRSAGDLAAVLDSLDDREDSVVGSDRLITGLLARRSEAAVGRPVPRSTMDPGAELACR